MMRVVFKKDWDGHAAGRAYTVERTLGGRLCAAGIAEAYSVWVEREARAEAGKKAADAAVADKAPDEPAVALDPPKKRSVSNAASKRASRKETATAVDAGAEDGAE